MIRDRNLAKYSEALLAKGGIPGTEGKFIGQDQFYSYLSPGDFNPFIVLGVTKIG